MDPSPVPGDGNTMLQDQIQIVQLGPELADCLWPMLCYAAAVDGPLCRAIPEAQADPFLRKYAAEWGKLGDQGTVAIRHGTPIGAAWIRLLKHDFYGPGIVAPNVPELAVGVEPDFRGCGIGTALLRRLLADVAGLFPAMVLSVREENPAAGLYRRLGFLPVQEIANRAGGRSLVMRRPDPDFGRTA